MNAPNSPPLSNPAKASLISLVRFGYTERTVEKRLALARLSPILQEAYRAEQINMDVLQAFTLSADHQAQEEVWSRLPAWNRNAHNVRQLLCAQTVPATDERVNFIGLAAYETAGGTLQRDLFHDNEGHGVYLTDVSLLTRLVTEKLERAAATVRGTGWRWIEIQPELDYQALGKYRRLSGKPLPLPDKLQKQLDSLEKKRQQLGEKLNSAEEDETFDENKLAKLEQEFEEAQNRILAIEAQRQYEFSKKVKGACGVIVSIGDNGPAFTYGLLKKEDQRLLEPKSKATTPGDQDTPEETDSGNAISVSPAEQEEENSPIYSASLVEDLTTAKTAAIAIELSKQPNIALAAVVHAMLLSDFGMELGDYRRTTCLDIATRHPNLEPAKTTKAYLALEEQRAHWLALLMKESPRAIHLWDWCLAQPQETLLSLLAFCSARTVTAIQRKDANNSANLHHANALAIALNMDMAHWFTPDTQNFFGRISKPQIAQALTEAGKALDSSKLAWKKAPLAEFAEREIAGTNWLPAPVRITPPPPAAEDEE